MWLSTSLSAALWLAACALAGIHDQTTTNADGIRSIPVCLPSCPSRKKLFANEDTGIVAHAYSATGS